MHNSVADKGLVCIIIFFFPARRSITHNCVLYNLKLAVTP
jgi:hypothetical protein